MTDTSDLLREALLAWFEPDSCEAGLVPDELERLAVNLADVMEVDRIRREGPESREPFPTRLKYGASEFSGPRDVYLNGQRVQGVQKLTIEHEDVQFSRVTLVLGGVLVQACPVEVT